jgi:hypothetical protein
MPNLSKAFWTVTVDSIELGSGANLVNGDYTLANRWKSAESGWPHWFSVDLGAVCSFDSFVYYPWVGGKPYTVELYISDDGINWGTAVGSDDWELKSGPDGDSAFYIMMPRQTARYVKFVGVTGPAGGGQNRAMQCCQIDLILEQGHNRYGWTATASSQLDAGSGPERALDEYNRNSAYSYWVSGDSVAPGNILFPHWIAVDMQTPHACNYIKYTTSTIGSQTNPSLVRAYISDKGSDWTQVGEQVWPLDRRTQWVYFENADHVLVTHTCRYFKLEGVTDEGHEGNSIGRMICAEIYSGELHEDDDYKVYRKVHPTVLEDLTPQIDPSHIWGTVEYLSVVATGDDPQAAHVRAKIKLWMTNSLAFYSEFLCSGFDFPEGWKDLPLESISVVAEGQHYNAAVVFSSSVGSLAPVRGSAQNILVDSWSWSVDSGEWLVMRQNKAYDILSGWYDVVTAEYLETCYSSFYIMQSLMRTAPSHNDADCTRLLLDDHYFLLVYGATYVPPGTPPTPPPPVTPPGGQPPWPRPEAPHCLLNAAPGIVPDFTVVGQPLEP